MAGLFVPVAGVQGVTRDEPLHESRQIGARRSDKKMKVIVHDRVGVHNAAIRLGVVGQLGEEALVIGRVEENARPPVAARGDVVKAVFTVDAWWTSHPASNASKAAGVSSAILRFSKSDPALAFFQV